MNFALIDLDDDTLTFWRDVRAYLDEHVTDEIREHERTQGGGISRSLHRALGARGWIMPGWPIEEGGAALDPVRVAILERELLEHDAPYQVMASHRLVLETIRRYGSDELKAEVVPAATRGDLVATLGYTEPGAGSDVAAVRTRAVRDGDEWVVSGQKIFTTGAHLADFSMVLARSNPDLPKHKGLTMLLVPLTAGGVEIQAVQTLGGERTNIVFYDDVRVPDAYRLGDVDNGWIVGSAALGAEHGLQHQESPNRNEPPPIREREGAYTWAVRQLHDAAVAWARANGLIDDPFVRYRLAEAALAGEVAAVTPGPYGRNVSSVMLIDQSSSLTDLVGLPALLLDDDGHDDASRVGEWYFFAPATAIYGGTTDIHRNLIAEKMLGLPRSTPRPPR